MLGNLVVKNIPITVLIVCFQFCTCLWSMIRHSAIQVVRSVIPSRVILGYRRRRQQQHRCSGWPCIVRLIVAFCFLHAMAGNARARNYSVDMGPSFWNRGSFFVIDSRNKVCLSTDPTMLTVSSRDVVSILTSLGIVSRAFCYSRELFGLLRGLASVAAYSKWLHYLKSMAEGHTYSSPNYPVG